MYIYTHTYIHIHTFRTGTPPPSTASTTTLPSDWGLSSCVLEKSTYGAASFELRYVRLTTMSRPGPLDNKESATEKGLWHMRWWMSWCKELAAGQVLVPTWQARLLFRATLSSLLPGRLLRHPNIFRYFDDPIGESPFNHFAYPFFWILYHFHSHLGLMDRGRAGL